MIDIRLDTLGCEAADAGTGAVLAVWCVSEGEHVRAGQPLARVRAPLETVELTAPRAGVIEQLLVPAGDPVRAGQVLARLIDT